MKTRNPAVLIPLIPLSFVLGYQYDMTKGNKMERILGKGSALVQWHNMWNGNQADLYLSAGDEFDLNIGWPTYHMQS